MDGFIIRVITDIELDKECCCATFVKAFALHPYVASHQIYKPVIQHNPMLYNSNCYQIGPFTGFILNQFGTGSFDIHDGGDEGLESKM
ncbi:hypothetical protein GQ457_01G018880 [Hibiscus cannabinus]